MLTVATAYALKGAGVPWSPAPGDRFVIADRDMDDEVFVLSDMTIEARAYPTGTVLAFNGTTEWALDSVAAESALWLPREDQLRRLLGPRFVGLRRGVPGFEVGTQDDGGHSASWTGARDPEEAYALAVLTAEAAENPVRLLPLAAEGFGWRVHAVRDDGWEAPTPLDGWSVRDLVTHVVGEHLWAPHLLAGHTLEQVGNRYDGDVLGEEPVAAWDRAIDRSLRSWARLRDGDQPVHTSAGPIPAREYAEQMLLDLTVHAWDLARGGGSHDRLDTACAQHVLGYARRRAEGLHRSGLFKAAVHTSSPEPQDRLLALLGRDPR